MLLGVDVGGTFTDAVLVAGGRLYSAKAPTTPDDESRGVLDAVSAVLAAAGGAGRDVRAFAHGMTVATNALLEGRGARTALIATDGFTDIVELARQARPRLYELCATNPPPLAPAELRFAAPERMGPGGPLRPLAQGAAEELVDAVARAAPQAVAVALLHSYARPEHERALGALLAARLPEAHVSLSHEVVGTFREYERAATTEVDAALSPLLAGYLRRLVESARAADLPPPSIMQSSGGLADAGHAAAHAALTVLSGPAGGAGGAALLGRAAGERDLLCFDMGGTSCDVCVIDGLSVRETAERVVGGRPLALPMLDIHTVGAGGGSIGWRDAGGALRVGPQSAGAVPGPACYGRGGDEATVTDANLLLGYLPDDAPLAGGIALDRTASERVIARLGAQLGLDAIPCAEGIVRVANAEMLRALRVMTVERGIDPRRYALLPFGGAGPLHAAAIAEDLGITQIVCPRSSGVLSALGLAAAAPRRDLARSVLRSGARLHAEAIADDVAELLARARAALGADPERVRVRYELRYRGQSFELGVEQPARPDLVALREVFERAHEERYGYRDPDGELELVTVRVSVWGPTPRVTLGGEARAPVSRTRQVSLFAGEQRDVDVWRGEPSAGTTIVAPAIVALPEATLVVPPGWRAGVEAHGTIRLVHGGGDA